MSALTDSYLVLAADGGFEQFGNWAEAAASATEEAGQGNGPLLIYKLVGEAKATVEIVTTETQP